MPELRTIPLGLIDEPPLPVRSAMDDAQLAELVSSIKGIGLLQPIMVSESDGRYTIITGHRRFIACGMAGKQQIAAFVYPAGYKHQIAAMIAENSCREAVNAADEARWFAELVELHSYTEEMLISLTHRSADYIGDRFRLLRGDEQVFAAVQRGAISLSVAREINKCEAEDMRRYFLDAACRGEHSQRTVRRWVDEWRARLVPQGDAVVSEAVASPVPTDDPFKLCCAMCGGDKDPYNLVTITIHKWEWEQLQRAVKESARAD